MEIIITPALVFGVCLAGWLLKARRERRAALLARLESLDWSRGPVAVAWREHLWLRFYADDAHGRYGPRYLRFQIGADWFGDASPGNWCVSAIMGRSRRYEARIWLLAGTPPAHRVYAGQGCEIAREREAVMVPQPARIIARYGCPQVDTP